MKQRSALLTSCAVCTVMTLAALGASTTAFAQADAGAQNGVEQIVVTAERRGAENLLVVPMAVDAFSAKTLEDFNIHSLQGLSKVDPSLDIQNFGADQERIIIRGISSSIGSTTGVYFDEAPLVGGFNGNILGDSTPELSLHDIDHIEVLKGPQGTLFGAGSMDGTVRIITNKPNLESYEGEVGASAAGVENGNALFDGEAMVNIPLIDDQLGVRLVTWGAEGGGFIDQTIAGTTRHDVNDEHMYGARFEALWKPTEKLSILFTANTQDTVVLGSQAWTMFVGPLTAPGGPEEGPFPPYQNHSPTQEPYRDQYSLLTLNAQYDLGFGSIVATTTYADKEQLQLIDTTPSDCSYGLCAGTPAYPVSFATPAKFNDYTEEVRFSSNFDAPFQIVAGEYYEEDYFDYGGDVLHANAANGILPCNTYHECVADGLVQPGLFVSPVEYAVGDLFSVNQYALYAQGDWKILPDLTATVGFRYFSAGLHDVQITDQNIAPTVTPYGFDGGYVLGDVTKPYVSSQSVTHESRPTYNFALMYQIDPDISLYSRVASGFRIGGINGAANIAAEEGIKVPATFAPDHLWDYEAGAKAYFLDGRLFFDASYYHISWSGQQEDALAAGVYNYTLNVGTSTMDGVELSSTYRPITDLTLGADITYVNATLSSNLPPDVVANGTPGVSGDRMPYVPHLSVSGTAQYEHPVMEGIMGYLAGDFTYHSNSYSAFQAVPAAAIAAGAPSNFYTELKPYFLLDLQAGVRFDSYDLSIFADNVTNNAAMLGAEPVLDAVRIFSPRPRTIGVRAVAHF